MARNLVLFDPAVNCWGLVCLIKKTGWEKDHTVVGFYQTEEEAKELADDLPKNPFWFVEAQYMEYTHKVTEGQYFHNYKIDAVFDRRN